MSESKNSRKILIMGLDNSGKTSIVESLKGRNLMSGIEPTKGYTTEDVEIDGTRFNIWDFGGQITYRTEHLARLDDYLYGSNKFIYVIDIQEHSRYDSSLGYLEDIMAKLIKRNTEDLDITIFLHKFDPNFFENYLEITEEMITNLIFRIKNIIPEKYHENIFKTTIYTVFERTGI